MDIKSSWQIMIFFVFSLNICSYYSYQTFQELEGRGVDVGGAGFKINLKGGLGEAEEEKGWKKRMKRGPRYRRRSRCASSVPLNRAVSFPLFLPSLHHSPSDLSHLPIHATPCACCLYLPQNLVCFPPLCMPRHCIPIRLQPSVVRLPSCRQAGHTEAIAGLYVLRAKQSASEIRTH